MAVFLRTSLTVLVISLACPLSAMAQQSSSNGGSKWTVEVHGGRSFGAGGSAGAGIANFPTGAPITMGGGRGGSPTLGRAVPSWFFGDGAAMVNAMNAAYGVQARITPLDDVLRRRILDRENSTAYGVRVARSLTAQLSAELAVDYLPSSVRLNDGVKTAIDATSASFESAWNGLIGTGATSNRTVTSAVEIRDSAGSQISTAAALTMNFRGRKTLRPYIVVGGGVVSTQGASPSVVLTGHYRFDFANTYPFDETDRVTIRTTTDRHAPVVLYGTGVTFGSPKRGLRFDARVHLRRDSTVTLVDAHPVTLVLAPAYAVATGLNSGVLFSNNPSTGLPSSLSGKITDLPTFTSRGWQQQVNISAGYYVRF